MDEWNALVEAAYDALDALSPAGHVVYNRSTLPPVEDLLAILEDVREELEELP